MEKFNFHFLLFCLCFSTFKLMAQGECEVKALFSFENISTAKGKCKYQFTSNSMVEGYSVITDYHWDFGDGTFSSLQNPTHTYLINGTYTVTLTIQGEANIPGEFYVDHCSDSETHTFTVSCAQDPEPECEDDCATAGNINFHYYLQEDPEIDCTSQGPNMMHAYFTTGFYGINDDCWEVTNYYFEHEFPYNTMMGEHITTDAFSCGSNNSCEWETTLYVTVENENGYSCTLTYSEIISYECTGSPFFKNQSSFYLVKNKATNKVQVVSKTENIKDLSEIEVVVYNHKGQEVKRQFLDKKGSSFIDTQELRSGFYILHFVEKGKSLDIKKLIL